jgi:hypothetical protein
MAEKSSPELTTSDIISEMSDVRTERRNIATRDKELVARWRTLEMELMLRLDEQGVVKAATGVGTASITETVLPQVVDWDMLHAHIAETGDFHLLQKRPAAAAFRELHQSGETIPGIDPYVKREISLRNK